MALNSDAKRRTVRKRTASLLRADLEGMYERLELEAKVFFGALAAKEEESRAFQNAAVRALERDSLTRLRR